MTSDRQPLACEAISVRDSGRFVALLTSRGMGGKRPRGGLLGWAASQAAQSKPQTGKSKVKAASSACEADDDDAHHSSDGSEASEPPHKERKLQPLPNTAANTSACGICGRARASGQDKLVTIQSITYSRRLALCETHAAVFQKVFSFMDIGEVVAKYHAGDGFQANFAEAEANMKKASAPFIKEQVGSGVTYNIAVERRALVLNALEWKKEFGALPRIRKLRYHPTMMIMNEDFEMEKVWLFRYQPSHFRSVVITVSQGVSKNMVLMPKENHLYKSQSDDTLMWRATQTKSEGEADAMTSKLPLLGSMYAKFGLTAPAGAQVVPTTRPFVAACSGDRQEECDDDQPEEEEDEGAGIDGPLAALDKADDSAEGEETQEGMVLLTSIAQLVAEPSVRSSPAAKQRGPTFGRHTPPSRKAGDDDASVMSRRTLGGKGNGNKKKSEPYDADGWIEQLDLQQATMDGKLGVEKHHALQAVSRWLKSRDPQKKQDAQRLNKHLGLFAMAQTLTPARIGSEELDDKELATALEQIRQKIQLPTPVEVAVLCRFAHKLKVRVYDRSGCEKLVSMLWPWRSTTDARAFDDSQPLLSDIDIPIVERVELFGNVMMQDIIVGLLSGTLQGIVGDAMVVLQHLLDIMQVLVDAKAQSEEVYTTIEARALFELATVCGGVAGLLDLGALVVHPDAIDRLSAVGDMIDSEKGDTTLFLQSVALAMEGSERLRQAKAVFLSKRAALAEAIPLVSSHMDAINATCAADPLEKSIEEMTTALKAYPRIACSIGTDLMRPLNLQTLAAVIRLYDMVEKGWQAKAMPFEKLGLVGELLKASGQAFPGDKILYDLQAKHAQLHASAASETQVAEFEALLSSLASHKVVLEKAEDIQGAADLMVGVQVAGATDHLIKSAMGMMFNCIEETYPDKKCLSVIRAYAKLAVLTTPTKEATVLDGFEYGVQALLAMQVLMAEKGDDGVVDFSKALANTEALGKFLLCATRASVFTDGLKQEVAHEAKARALFANTLDEVSRFRQELGKVAYKVSDEKVQEIEAELSPLQFGAPDGQNWINSLEKKKRDTWSAFEAHAKKTLAQNKAVAGMLPRVKELVKVELSPISVVWAGSIRLRLGASVLGALPGQLPFPLSPQLRCPRPCRHCPSAVMRLAAMWPGSGQWC